MANGTRDVEHHPLERKTDTSLFFRVNAKLGEYRSLVYLIAAIALTLGFKYSTPSQRITAMEAKVEPIENAVKVLVKLQCFNPTFSDYERDLAGLDCTKLRTSRRGPHSDSVVTPTP